MYIIALDDGHGLETAGKETPIITELGRIIKENEFNYATKLKLKTALERCGLKVVDVAPGQTDIPLLTRVTTANNAKADIYVSIHYNAYDGVFDTNLGGISTFHYTGSTKGEKLARTIHKYLIQGTKQRDRKVQSANFYVLKYTNMPAVLTENGFMDDRFEASLMLKEEFQMEAAEEHCQGICEYLGVPYVTNNSKPILKIESIGIYVVELQEFLNTLGHNLTTDGIFGPATEASVKVFQTANGLTIDGIVGPQTYTKIEELQNNSESNYLYRVVTGSFNNAENAEKRQKELQEKGFSSYIWRGEV